MTTTEFGAGVFDEEPVADATEVNEEPADEKIELTDREVAIAEGRNPDEAEATEEPEETPDEEVVAEEPEVEEPEFSESDIRLASMYGLSNDDVGKFDSPKSLHAALDLLEARKESSGADADGSVDSTSDADEDGGAISDILGFKKTDPDAVAKIFSEKDEDGEPLYDEGTTKFVTEQAKQLRQTQDLLEKVLSGQADSAQEAEAEKNRKTFHNALDKMPEVYGASVKDGKPVELNAQRVALRQEVADHVQTVYAGLVARGSEIPPLEKMIEQSIKAVHADKVAEAKSRAKSLTKQSKSRRSPGTKVKPAKKVPADGMDQFDAAVVANDPELVEFFDNAQFENGVGR
jgi:hypothetical protein